MLLERKNKPTQTKNDKPILKRKNILKFLYYLPLIGVPSLIAARYFLSKRSIASGLKAAKEMFARKRRYWAFDKKIGKFVPDIGQKLSSAL
jgi:hypothetical protein